MPIGSSDGNLYENESAHALGIPMEPEVKKVADKQGKGSDLEGPYTPLSKKEHEALLYDTPVASSKDKEMPASDIQGMLDQTPADRQKQFDEAKRAWGNSMVDTEPSPTGRIRIREDHPAVKEYMKNLPPDVRVHNMGDGTVIFRKVPDLTRPALPSEAFLGSLDSVEAIAKGLETENKLPNLDYSSMPLSTNIEDRRKEIPITAPPAKDESLQNIDNWYMIREIPKFLKSLQNPQNQELLNELWPVKAVKGLVESAKGLMDPMPAPGTRPEDFTDIPGVDTHPNIGRVADIAGLITLGPAPLAGKLANGTLGSFAGVGALGTNFKALSKAQEMFQTGKSATEIWKETGFFKGLDNKWRWEIPGAEKATLHPGLADVKIPPDGNVSISLGGLLNYPQLFEAYPHLRNMKVILDNDVRGPNGKLVFGGINEKGDTIVLNLDAMKMHNYPVKDVLIHEIQHLIQVKEGFPRGTNPKAAIDAAELTLRRKLLDRIEELNSKGHSFQDRAKDPYYAELKGVMKELMTNREALSEHIYRATPGELEANLAAYRAQKPGDLKRMSPPTKSLDILSVIKPVEYPAPFRMPDETTLNRSQSKTFEPNKFKEPGAPANINTSQEEVRAMIPEPLKPLDRIWQNYVKHMSPEEMLSSEPVWSTAKNVSNQLGISESEAFAHVANDMFQRMGSNRYMTTEVARKYMGKERGIKPVK